MWIDHIISTIPLEVGVYKYRIAVKHIVTQLDKENHNIDASFSCDG